MIKYNNVTQAFHNSLELIMKKGRTISVRGNETKEIAPHSFSIKKPQERVYLINKRENNIFSTIAEILWVVGGRNDIEYLTYYLPRATDFSDDGKVWRAGYGSRLRHWNDVDQFKEIVNLLKSDKNSRRAVIAIFDPDRDFIDSKDIPCNNWLHFLIRENKLYLNIAVRSCDIMWGFTGINTFEWSVIQEMVAYWTGIEVGEMSFFISSFHLYNRHYDRAKEVQNHSKIKTLYDFGIKPPKFSTSFEDFDKTMEHIFDLENKMRTNIEVLPQIKEIKDDFLRNSLLMLLLHSLWKNNNTADIPKIINELDDCDYKIAAIEFFVRKQIITAPIAYIAYFDYYNQETETVTFSDLIEHFNELHRKKTLIYKDSWKKHGEILSVFSNISRKYDRIESIHINKLTETFDESLFDTIADLAIYAVKYFTLIAELYPTDFYSYFKEHIQQPDDIYKTNDGFLLLCKILEIIYLNNIGLNEIQDDSICIERIKEAYSKLETMLLSKNKDNNIEKCDYIKVLSIVPIHLLTLIGKKDKNSLNKFISSIKNM
jgi:thymidylate synthase